MKRFIHFVIKETRMKLLVNIAVAAATTFAMVGSAGAQEWPNKPIKLVVPFGPGGSTDITARLLAQKLSEELGQSVFVENRGGAGGNIGAAVVARAEPDGYTILMATSTHVTNPSLYKELNYDVLKDLTAVSQVAFIPNMLVVNKDLPVSDLREFVDYVAGKKGPVHYGSSGNGTSQHLAAALFNNMAKGGMVHVPYKGGGAAVTELLGGRIQAYFAPLAEVVPYIESGKVRALATTTKERAARFPEVPSVGEVLEGYELALWNGILAPAKTPVAIVNKISAAIQKGLKDPEIQKKLAEQGSIPVGSSPSVFAKFMESEVPKWGRIVNISGATVN